MLALDCEYTPIMMPLAGDPMLAKFGAGNADIDGRIKSWLATARLMAMAYRKSLQPQTERFKRDLAEFDRCHAETPERRRSLVWRLPALSIVINRMWWCAAYFDEPTIWRCYALHLADFAELKANGFPCLPVDRELAYALMAGSFLKAATRGTP